jgi:hypothetical protein
MTDAVAGLLGDMSAAAVAFECLLELGEDCEDKESLVDMGLIALPQIIDEISCWLWLDVSWPSRQCSSTKDPSGTDR